MVMGMGHCGNQSSLEVSVEERSCVVVIWREDVSRGIGGLADWRCLERCNSWRKG